MQNPVPAGQEAPKARFPFGNLLKALLALALIWVVFSKTNFSEVWSLRAGLSLPWALATLLLYLLLTFLKAFQYHSMFEGQTSYPRVVSIVVWQNALSNFVAAGAGVASYFALFKTEENIKFGRSTLVFLMTKAGDLFSVWAVLVVSSLLLWERIAPLRAAVILLAVVIGLGLLVFALVIVFRRPLSALLARVLAGPRLSVFALVRKGAGAVQAFAEQDPVFIRQMVGRAFLLSFAYYLLTLAWMTASLRMFSAPPGLWEIVFVSGILQLLSVVPITIFGSLGVSEVTSLYLYELFGFSQDLMSPILLAWRAVFYLMNLFVLLYLPLYALISGRSSR